MARWSGWIQWLRSRISRAESTFVRTYGASGASRSHCTTVMQASVHIPALCTPATATTGPRHGQQDKRERDREERQWQRKSTEKLFLSRNGEQRAESRGSHKTSLAKPIALESVECLQFWRRVRDTADALEKRGVNRETKSQNNERRGLARRKTTQREKRGPGNKRKISEAWPCDEMNGRKIVDKK